MVNHQADTYDGRTREKYLEIKLPDKDPAG